MTLTHLLHRLDQIAHSLAATPGALALLGLGSVGVERDRLDAYSDLDFFVIVAPGHKQRFLDEVGWLAAPCPIAYHFANTPDGFKLLYEDGVFCEMAVFEEAELAHIPSAEGRVVWAAEGVAAERFLNFQPPPPPPTRREEWMLGEALTCLLVGLLRYHRGEKLSAQRFIQHYAADRVLELAELAPAQPGVPRDPFVIERRVERRYPALAPHLPSFLQGYARSRESALALLAFIEDHYAPNTALCARIRALAEQGEVSAVSDEGDEQEP